MTMNAFATNPFDSVTISKVDNGWTVSVYGGEKTLREYIANEFEDAVLIIRDVIIDAQAAADERDKAASATCNEGGDDDPS